MENEERNGNPPEENAPGQPPQYNQPPQGPYPPSPENRPPPPGYPPQGGGQYPNQPPQYGPPPQGYPPQYYGGKNLYGVGGWLLFLCILLTIIAPLGAVYSILSIYIGPEAKDLHQVKNFSFCMAISSIGVALVTLFGLVAGLFLWNRWSNAVTIAKAYLIVAMAYNVFDAALHMSLVKYPHRPEFMFVYPAIIIGALIGIGINIAWFAYLCKSRRVAITYGLTKQDR